MNDIPLEIWQMIMLMSENMDQSNIKQVCKFLYTNLHFSESCLHYFCVKGERRFYKNSFCFIDIIKYIIEKHNDPATEIHKIITEMKTNREKKQKNCLTHVLYPYHGTYVICLPCGISYDCVECRIIANNNMRPSIREGSYMMVPGICKSCGYKRTTVKK